jgi:hypothetical protein
MLDQGQTATVGQGQVHRHQIGAMLGHGIDRLIGVLGLCDDIEVRFQLDQAFETLTNDGVVIYKDDSWHGQNVTGSPDACVWVEACNVT